MLIWKVSELSVSRINLIELYEVWNKPEKVKEWRAKLPKQKLR
jgi:hypothetical protein